MKLSKLDLTFFHFWPPHFLKLTNPHQHLSSAFFSILPKIHLHHQEVTDQGEDEGLWEHDGLGDAVRV